VQTDGGQRTASSRTPSPALRRATTPASERVLAVNPSAQTRALAAPPGGTTLRLRPATPTHPADGVNQSGESRTRGTAGSGQREDPIHGRRDGIFPRVSWAHGGEIEVDPDMPRGYGAGIGTSFPLPEPVRGCQMTGSDWLASAAVCSPSVRQDQVESAGEDRCATLPCDPTLGFPTVTV